MVSAQRRKVPVIHVSETVFDQLIDGALQVAEVPLVQTEYFLGGEVIHSVITAVYPYELSSIRAMEAHIAHERHVSERDIEALVEAEFSVEAISQIRHDDFRNVIAFLSDLRVDGVKR